MKCPNCGHTPTMGRPKKLDDERVKSLTKQGWSLSEIAKLLKVTKGAVAASLKRSEK